MSEECIEFIKSVEGFSAHPYYDYSQYTVGYGTRCPADKYDEYMTVGITMEEADAYLREFLVYFEDEVNRKIIDKNGLTLTQSQYDALVSFSFNLGTSWMSSGTLKKAIVNGGDAHEITAAFSLYCKAGGKIVPGLVTRRLCEANMFLNGVYSCNRSEDFGYVYYDANGGTIRYQIQGFMTDGSTAPAADATRKGYTFAGWYTDPHGGDKVTNLSRDMVGNTLFARWRSEDGSFVQESTSIDVKVTGDSINVRSGPGTSYRKIGRVYKNEVLTVTHVTDITNSAWGKFEDGWVSLSYTNYENVISGENGGESGDTGSDQSKPEEGGKEPGETGPSQPGTESNEGICGTIRIDNFLNVRSGPGVENPIVGRLYDGDRVTVYEKQAVGSSTWGRIGDEEWVSLRYVVFDSIDEGDSGDNPIPDEPGNGSSDESDSSNKPSDDPEDGMPTEPGDGANDNNGGVNDDQDGSTEDTSDADAILTGTVKVSSALRVRSGPGTDYAVVGSLRNNDKVQIFELNTDGARTWGKISDGWVCMDYIVIDSNEDSPSEPPGEVKPPVEDGPPTENTPPADEPPAGEEAENPFVDVPSDSFFFDAVMWAVNNKIAGGVGEGVFAPNAFCSRADIVTFIWRAAGCPQAESTCSFDDVNVGAYYYDAVSWAVDEGITLGTSAHTFDPDGVCTRAQAVTFFYRWNEEPSIADGNSTSPFLDVPNEAYCYDAILWAVNCGITNGVGAGRFAPDDFCRRGQIVTFLYRSVANPA